MQVFHQPSWVLWEQQGQILLPGTGTGTAHLCPRVPRAAAKHWVGQAHTFHGPRVLRLLFSHSGYAQELGARSCCEHCPGRSLCRAFVTADKSLCVAAGICLQVKIWLRVFNIIKGPALHCGAILAPWIHCKCVWWIQGIHSITSSIQLPTSFSFSLQFYELCYQHCIWVPHPLQLLRIVKWSHTERWESKMHTGGLLTMCFQCLSVI